MLAGIAVMLGAVLLLRTGKNRKAAVSADGDAKKEMVPEGRPRS
jgi:hypothetical protein